MNRTITGLAAVAAAAALAGCSSGSSSATGTVTSHPASTRPATVSGTERFSGTVRGAAVVANRPPTYPLMFTGPVAATGTFTPPDSNSTHQVGVFRTSAGNLVLTATVSGLNAQPQRAGAGCLFRVPIRAVYVVDGARSTGRFAGATGHGTLTADTRFTVPRKNGQCDTSRTAQPVAGSAVSVLTASGPLNVRQ